MKRSPIIGMTGPTGAGKSLAAKILTGYGCEVIDCDMISRELCGPGSPTQKKLAERFGGGIILPDGSLDRRALARVAFSSPENVSALNAITHPAIIAVSNERAMRAAKAGRPAVIDAAALFESGGDKGCDFTVVVTAPADIRIKRILARDDIGEKSVMERINAQKEELFYCERADYIVRNYPPHEIEKELLPVLARLGEQYDEKSK